MYKRKYIKYKTKYLQLVGGMRDLTGCICGQIDTAINQYFPYAQFKEGCNGSIRSDPRYGRSGDDIRIYRSNDASSCQFITDMIPSVKSHLDFLLSNNDFMNQQNTVAFYGFTDDADATKVTTVASANDLPTKDYVMFNVPSTDKDQIDKMVKHYAHVAIDMDTNFVKMIIESNIKRIFEFDVWQVNDELKNWYAKINNYTTFKGISELKPLDDQYAKCPQEFVHPRNTTCSIDSNEYEMLVKHNHTSPTVDDEEQSKHRILALGLYNDIEPLKSICPKYISVLEFFSCPSATQCSTYSDLEWTLDINKVLVWCNIVRNIDALYFPIVFYPPQINTRFDYITSNSTYLGMLRLPYYSTGASKEYSGNHDGKVRLNFFDLFYFKHPNNTYDLVSYRGNKIYDGLLDERYRVSYIELHILYYYAQKLVLVFSKDDAIALKTTVCADKTASINKPVCINEIYSGTIDSIKDDKYVTVIRMVG